MKKTVLFSAFCLIIVILVSCTIPYSFMHGEPDIDTIKIEIVNLETAMGYHEGSPYNEENISVIKVIENSKNQEFLSAFKEIKSYQANFGSRIDCISGEAIRITYKNGDIELITHYGTATVENGDISIQTITFDSVRFSEFLDKFS
ncbi:MAG: hypothetical protein E7595_07310 [Ruminococcaceae bacterium]|nr:hypothetical protein [Oscillospiraceae bacterium]